MTAEATTTAPIRGGTITTPTDNSVRVRSNREGVQLGKLKTLYMGKYGTGKTRYMLSWPGLVMLQADIEDTTLAAHANDVPVIDITSWDSWKRTQPYLRSRAKLLELVRRDPRFENYEVRGIGLDSWTGLAEMAHNRGLVENPGDTRAAYGTLLTAMMEAKDILFGPTRWSDPLYFTAAIHEREKWKTVNNQETLDDVLPTIAGSFGEQKFFSYWSSVLWTMRTVPATQDGGLIRGKEPRYFCRTDQIDAFRRGFDRWGRLPAEVAGDFPTLAGYWFPNAPETEEGGK